MPTWEDTKRKIISLTNQEKDYVENLAKLQSKLSAEMLSRNMTQAQLGELTGLAQPAISRFFNIERVPMLDTLHKIAYALGFEITLS